MTPNKQSLSVQPTPIFSIISSFLERNEAIQLSSTCKLIQKELEHNFWPNCFKNDFPFYSNLFNRFIKNNQLKTGAWVRLYNLAQHASMPWKVVRTIKCYEKIGSGLLSFKSPSPVRHITHLSNGCIAVGIFCGTVRIFSSEGRPLSTINCHQKFLQCLIPLDNGCFATSSSDKTARIWTLTGRQLATLNSHRHTVRKIIALSNRRLATCSSDCTARVWSYEGRPIAILIGHTDLVQSIKELTDGRIATGSIDSTVRFWSSTTYRLLATLNGSALFSDLIIALSNGRIAISNNNTVHIWSPTYTLLATLGRTNNVQCIKRLANERFATGSNDNIVHIWSSTTYTLLATLKGHKESIECISSLPNECIASGSRDGTVRIWSHKGVLTSILDQNLNHNSRDIVYCITTLANGLLATGSHDGRVRFWSVDFNRALKGFLLQTNNCSTC